MRGVLLLLGLLLPLAACDPDVPRAHVDFDAAIVIDAPGPDAEPPPDAAIDAEPPIDAPLVDAATDAPIDAPIDGGDTVPDASIDGAASPPCDTHAECGAGNCCFGGPGGFCIPGDPQPLPPPFDCQPA